MSDKIVFRKGLLENLEDLPIAAPGFITNPGEERLVIGGANGNVFLPNAKDINAINSSLNAKVNKTSSDITLYVSPSGNDENNGLSPDTSFRTIQHAIDILPQIVNHFVTINIAEGTYSEELNINGFSGKASILICGSGDLINSVKYKLDSLIISNCNLPITIKGLSFITTEKNVMSINYSHGIWIQYCSNTSESTFYGAYAIASLVTLRDCEISNKKKAIVADYNTTLLSHTNKGTNNNIVLTALNNATIGKVTIQPEGITAEIMANGGVIR